MGEEKKFHLRGHVITGFRVGNGFGVATANLKLLERDESVRDGVYFVEVCSEEKPQDWHCGLLHIGERKTFRNGFAVEVHLLDFEDDLYGDILNIRVLKRRRPIQKFQNADALYTQIEKDIVWARKYFLRRKILEKWEELNDYQRLQMGHIAVEHIQNKEEFQKAKRIFVFAPTRNEINFVQILCSRFKDKDYYFPKVVKNGMSFYPCDFEQLRPGKFGILEPQGGRPKVPENDDCILVPCVAVDKKYNRLGRGGGYYDRFLSKTHAQKICLVPDFAMVPKVPIESHDLPVDDVVVIESHLESSHP